MPTEILNDEQKFAQGQWIEDIPGKWQLVPSLRGADGCPQFQGMKCAMVRDEAR